VQELGLASTHKSRDAVRHFCGMLDGLAFLSLSDVAEGVAYLKDHTPDLDGMDKLAEYFTSTYASGSLRSVRVVTVFVASVLLFILILFRLECHNAKNTKILQGHKKKKVNTEDSVDPTKQKTVLQSNVNAALVEGIHMHDIHVPILFT